MQKELGRGWRGEGAEGKIELAAAYVKLAINLITSGIFRVSA